MRLAHELIEQARRSGVSLVGPVGLLTGVTRTVLQAALDTEMTEHLACDGLKGLPEAISEVWPLVLQRHSVRVVVGGHVGGSGRCGLDVGVRGASPTSA